MNDDREKEIEELRAANRILEEENSQLSERAEDAMLLGLVAEAIEGVTDPQQVMDQVVERISILKDLPFVTCGRLNKGMVERISSYSSFTDQDTAGYPLQLSENLCLELQQGPYIAKSLAGISLTLDYQAVVSKSVLLIPFACHLYGSCVFLFFDRSAQPERLPGMLFLLDQVVRLICSRLDNIFLTGQLERLNAELEERVQLKTRDLQEANASLQQMFKRFVAVLHGVDSYINVTDTGTYTILFSNTAAKVLFGENIEGRKCYEILRQEKSPCRFCKIAQLLAAPSEAEQVVTWESYNPGTGKWFLNSERILDWPESPQALLTIGTDITAVKQAQEEKQLLAKKLHQAQKMEAIGVLAGSIAHDLNNILSGVVSYPDFLLATMDPDPQMRQALETIRAAGNKGAGIVQGLLTLARKGIQVEEVVALDHLLDDYLESPECMNLLRNHQQVRISTPERQSGLYVKGSPLHLSNALMNLVNNGAEAMPDGGLITISLKRVELDSQPPGFLAWRAGAYARITVSDTGTGIPAEHVERVFEPFFSLKKPGFSGTGLGLAIVWGTVVDHGGSIDVENFEGRGTSFHILLPLVSGKGHRQEKSETSPLMRGHGEDVLVVDDDEQQRRLASEILEHLGYRVTTSASGEAAIEILKTTRVDLVILDMLMPPGMDGLETYERILVLRPGQKAIFVSGFSQSERVRKALSLGAGRFLQKPYILKDISEAMYEVLHR